MTLHVFSEKDVAEKPAAMGPPLSGLAVPRHASQRRTYRPSTGNVNVQDLISNIENQSLINQGNFMSMSNGFYV